MAMQVADVKRPPASAYRMVQTGNNIVLYRDYSYLETKSSGRITEITEKSDKRVFNIWRREPETHAAPKAVPKREHHIAALRDNRSAELAEVDGNEGAGQNSSWRDATY